MAQNDLGAPVNVTNSATNPIPVSSTAAAGSPGSAAATPSYQRSVGSASFATSQAPTSVSPAAALQVVAARAGRQAVTITNLTGTQQTFLLATNATTGVTTGFPLAAAVGASVTIATAAAVFATSPTAAQTLGILETF